MSRAVQPDVKPAVEPKKESEHVVLDYIDLVSSDDDDEEEFKPEAHSTKIKEEF